MQFLSSAKEQKLTLRPRMTRFITLDNGGKVPQIDPGLHVQFRGLSEPIPTEAFAAKDGKARGILDTKYAAKLAGIDEDELISILLNHKMHGILFGRVGDANENILPEMLHIIPHSDGYYCELCKKSLAKQGVHNHPKSGEHQRHLAAIEQEAREQLEAQSS
jgi:hypothetical protein